MHINKNYLNLQDSYLFSTIAKKVNAYQQQNPEKKIIRLGIGDVTLPLCNEVVMAMSTAVEEQSKKETFKGYGPEQGYNFLKEALQNYYKQKAVELELDEIFISDGAKSDLGNILDIFADDNTVLIPNPVYPAYLDTNIMLGNKVIFMDANESNGFLPMPNKTVKADIIYICSPNNPTGSAYNKNQLTEWVKYALENNAVILYDAASEAFV
ncbi:MAG: aminotransferase class I/II-fold pyridoxal phosphate-dependent enzyme, partial [Oscillospiraceae bacterium]